MSRFPAIAVLVMAGAAAAAAQQPTIQVNATGTAKADPDTAVVQFVIEGRAGSMASAYASAQKQAEALRGLLRQQGFAASDAHWSSYRQQPNFDYQTQKVADYTASVDCDLEMSDFSKIGPLLDASGAAGMSSVRGVSFELKHPEIAKTQAIADAYRQSHQEAEAMAQAASEHLGSILRATVDVTAPGPILRAASEFQANRQIAIMAAPTQGFTPQQTTVSARVSVTYWIEPQ